MFFQVNFIQKLTVSHHQILQLLELILALKMLNSPLTIKISFLMTVQLIKFMNQQMTLLLLALNLVLIQKK